MDSKALKKEKIRAALHWIFGVVAVISFVVTLLLSPLGDFLKTKLEKPQTDVVSTTSPTENKGEINNSETTISETEFDVTIEDTKNYSLLIFKKVFISAEDEDKTIIYAKADKDAKMTITPIKGTSYKALCDKTASEYKKISDYQEINTKNIYSVYESEADGFIKRVYCIDDGVGSSIEIKYQYAKDDEDTKQDFDILLSMFKTK